MDLLCIYEGGELEDSLTLTVFEPDRAYIRIENPWSGDTEHGFGADASFTLTKDQARELAAKLLEWAK